MILAATPPPAHVDAGDGDDSTDFDFPRMSVVPAAGLPAPKTVAPRSIWDLAAVVAAAKKMRGSGGRFGAAAGFVPQEPAKAGTVERAIGDGVTRCTGAQYPSNRWDTEREEKERQRRARQKPPKPSKKAKRRSKKLLDTIGDNVWDD